MADQQVNIQFSASDQNLLAMWDKMRRDGPEKTLESLKQLKAMSGATKSDFEKMATAIIGGLSAAQLAQKALNVAIQEGVDKYRQMVQNQREAASFQVSAAGAQRAALRNLSPGGDVSPQQLVSGITGIAKSTGADINSLYQAVGGSLSATGKMPQSEAVKQLAAVAKLDPSLAGGEMKALVGASLNIRKAFGGTPEQAIGAMLAGQQTARVEDTGQYAANVVGPLAGLAGFGGDFRSSSAIIAAISQESADAQGAMSGTAAITLAKQVQEHTANVKSLEGKGTAERLAWLRSDAGATIRNRMLGTMSADNRSKGVDAKGELTGEAKTIVAMAGLLTPGSSTMQAYEAALANTPAIENAGAFYDSTIAAQQGLTFQRTARTAEVFGGATQKFLSRGKEALAGEVRGELFKTIGHLNGVGWNMPFQEKLESMRYEREIAGGMDPRLSAANILERRGATAAGVAGAAFMGTDQSHNQLLRELQELIATLRDQAKNDPLGKLADAIAEDGRPRQERRATPQPSPAAALNGR